MRSPLERVLSLIRLHAPRRQLVIYSKISLFVVRSTCTYISSKHCIIAILNTHYYKYINKSYESAFNAMHRYGTVRKVGLLVLFRSLSSWYKGVAGYELLMDAADHHYHQYGCAPHDLGPRVLGAMANTLSTLSAGRGAVGLAYSDYTHVYITQVRLMIFAPLSVHMHIFGPYIAMYVCYCRYMHSCTSVCI